MSTEIRSPQPDSANPDRAPDGARAVEAFRIRRAPLPHPNLLTYYLISSLALGPLFPVLLVPRYFRFRTLRYRFDDEGVTMRWGILFRREISLTYARIQDIHLTSNILERWLGLAKIQIQTASGSANAEMTIEGLQEFEQIRDYLYSRMRGAREKRRAPEPPAHAGTALPLRATPLDGAVADELTATLHEVAAEMRALRAALTRGQDTGGEVRGG